MFQEVSKRHAETVTNEENVMSLNRDLSAQMAQMIQEYDDDKRQALNK